MEIYEKKTTVNLINLQSSEININEKQVYARTHPLPMAFILTNEQKQHASV